MNPHATLPPIAEAGEADFEAVVLRASEPVLVAFLAGWSRPCQVLAEVLASVANTGRIKVVRVNADDNPELGMWYGIQSIPTLLFFAGGQVRATIVGTASAEAILARLPEARTPAAVPKPAPAPMLARRAAKRALHHVNFFCEAPGATQVCLAGDFNDWQPAALPMQRMPDGRWQAGVELAHGHHQYVFLVDGQPALDPRATGKARNERNEQVSIIAVS